MAIRASVSPPGDQVADVQRAVDDGRRGVDDPGEAVARPQLPAVGQVVAHQLQRTGHDDLPPAVRPSTPPAWHSCA